jgi:hypothetical protein
MKFRAHRTLLCCVLIAGAMPNVLADVTWPPDGLMSVAPFLVAEATAGDLNGDGDSLDVVLHVMDAQTGVTVNLGFAVPVVCDLAFPPGFCSPAQPVVGDTIFAFLVSEAAQGAMDLNRDGDASDDVLFLYDDRQGEVQSTELAVAHGVTRSVSFIRFPIPPAVFGDVIVFLVAEAEQGGRDLNHDGDVGDAVIHLVAPKKSRKTINVGLAAPGLGHFSSPVLVASGDGNFVNVLVGEREQGQDLNRDDDQDDAVTMEIRVQNGKARLAE